MKRIISVVLGASLIFGLGAVSASNVLNTPKPQAPAVVKQTQFCQTCFYTWNPKTQSYVRTCYLVVCHAV
jgi:hypothetical protein